MIIGTHKGYLIDLNNIDERLIDIEDIAWSLGQTNRFNGHCPIPYNVAIHSVWVAGMAERGGETNSVIQYCLMHDAIEAYIGDVVWGIKQGIPAFLELEDRMSKVIERRFNLDPEVKEIVDLYDRIAGMTECKVLMPQLYDSNKHFHNVDYAKFLGESLQVGNAPQGRRVFMKAYERIFNANHTI